MADLGLAPQAVQFLAQRLLAEIQAILGERLVGLYWGGSLASGGFDPYTSDVDFLTVTDGELPPEMLAELKAMHVRLAASGLAWADHMEGSYIPRDAIRRFDPGNTDFPAMGAEDGFAIGRHGYDWIIQRHILRQHGVVIFGPAPVTLIDPVTPDALRRSTAGILEEWWRPKLIDPSLLRSPEYQAFAIKTMCRALYTLERGEVASKPAACRWAQDTLGPPWPGLIEQALAWRRGRNLDLLPETLDFIRFALERSQQRREGSAAA